jgi:hypothetical protein
MMVLIGILNEINVHVSQHLMKRVM